MRFYREGTAPSIPVPGQSYGYEEDEDGVLKPQKLPPRDSTMGPAYYSVAHVRECVCVCGGGACERGRERSRCVRDAYAGSERSDPG